MVLPLPFRLPPAARSWSSTLSGFLLGVRLLPRSGPRPSSRTTLSRLPVHLLVNAPRSRPIPAPPRPTALQVSPRSPSSARPRLPSGRCTSSSSYVSSSLHDQAAALRLFPRPRSGPRTFADAHVFPRASSGQGVKLCAASVARLQGPVKEKTREEIEGRKGSQLAQRRPGPGGRSDGSYVNPRRTARYLRAREVGARGRAAKVWGLMQGYSGAALTADSSCTRVADCVEGGADEGGPLSLTRRATLKQAGGPKHNGQAAPDGRGAENSRVGCRTQAKEDASMRERGWRRSRAVGQGGMKIGRRSGGRRTLGGER